MLDLYTIDRFFDGVILIRITKLENCCIGGKFQWRNICGFCSFVNSESFPVNEYLSGLVTCEIKENSVAAQLVL